MLDDIEKRIAQHPEKGVVRDTYLALREFFLNVDNSAGLNGALRNAEVRQELSTDDDETKQIGEALNFAEKTTRAIIDQNLNKLIFPHIKTDNRLLFYDQEEIQKIIMAYGQQAPNARKLLTAVNNFVRTGKSENLAEAFRDAYRAPKNKLLDSAILYAERCVERYLGSNQKANAEIKLKIKLARNMPASDSDIVPANPQYKHQEILSLIEATTALSESFPEKNTEYQELIKRLKQLDLLLANFNFLSGNATLFHIQLDGELKKLGELSEEISNKNLPNTIVDYFLNATTLYEKKYQQHDEILEKMTSVKSPVAKELLEALIEFRQEAHKEDFTNALFLDSGRMHRAFINAERANIDPDLVEFVREVVRETTRDNTHKTAEQIEVLVSVAPHELISPIIPLGAYSALTHETKEIDRFIQNCQKGQKTNPDLSAVLKKCEAVLVALKLFINENNTDNIRHVLQSTEQEVRTLGKSDETQLLNSVIYYAEVGMMRAKSLSPYEEKQEKRGAKVIQQDDIAELEKQLAAYEKEITATKTKPLRPAPPPPGAPPRPPRKDLEQKQQKTSAPSEPQPTEQSPRDKNSESHVSLRRGSKDSD